MTKTLSLSSLFLLIITILSSAPQIQSRKQAAPNPCDPRNKPDPKTLRPDQITVLINGYSETRIPLLQSIASKYGSSPIVSSVLILWGNPQTSLKTLTLLSHNLSASYTGTAPITVLRQPTDSLNSRFLPRRAIRTRAVLICDDDVEIDTHSLEFAFKIWSSNRHKLIGPFARSHDMDINSRSWIYTVHPDKYSIILTKLMMMKTEYLYKYSCQGGAEMEEARGVVDGNRNCEDILMNFVAAEEGGPLLVGVEKARDWGDARNDNDKEGVKEMGLSSRRGDHRKRRGECIREFHRIFGRMPLRYSYGKVVDSVGEQGLCDKGGKLVFCDHF